MKTKREYHDLALEALTAGTQSETIRAGVYALLALSAPGRVVPLTDPTEGDPTP